MALDFRPFSRRKSSTKKGQDSMKKLSLILGAIGLCAFTLGAQVEAQMQPVPPPVTGSQMLRQGRGFNPATVVTVKGTVTALNRVPARRPNQQVQVQMLLQTPQGTVNVQLGPAAYLDQHPVKIAPGDLVEVTGSDVTKRKRTRIIAAQIRKGNQILPLRDETGRPLWRQGMRVR